MRSVLLCLCLVTFGSAFMHWVKMNDETVQVMANTAQRQVLALTPCNDILWNSCQAKFNDQLGFEEGLTYVNGTKLFNLVSNKVKASLPDILKTCNQRTAFYQCLGTSYYSCINLFTVLNKNPDYQNSLDYTRAYSSLEFMCNAGFEEVVNQWPCLGSIPTTNAVQSCLNNFNETVNPNVLCGAVTTTGKCLNDAYKAGCTDLGAGYYGCENFRFTFNQVCYGLRCIVG